MQPATGHFVVDQLGVICLDSYLPAVGAIGAVDELKHNWMWMTLEMPDRGHALGSSFAALCLSRVGLVTKDENMISAARTQYAAGLMALRHALQRPDLAFQAQTLAAIRTLEIYEVSQLCNTNDTLQLIQSDVCHALHKHDTGLRSRRGYDTMVPGRRTAKHQHVFRTASVPRRALVYCESSGTKPCAQG